MWLDDTPTEHYLAETGRDGLSKTDLLNLIDRDNRTGPIVVLDTLWRDRYLTLTTAPHPADPQEKVDRDRWRDAREALALADEPVDVADQFSPTERNRAAVPAATDLRLADALADTQFGVTQVLAGAPELLAHWHRADPYAHAVITAAIDATRSGIRAPLTISLLEEAATGYLTDRQRAEASTGWFHAALDYSTKHGKGTTAPLLPHPGATLGEINGYTVSDYLNQYASRERRSARVPASTWDAAIGNISDPADAARLAASANNRLLYRYATPLYRLAADVGDQHAALGLADLLARRGDLDELRTRADAGDDYAAMLLVRLLRTRADNGDGHAAGQLADLLAEHGDLDELRARAAPLAEHGDLDELRARAAPLAEHGDLDELRARAAPLAEHGDLDELRTRADNGDGHAAGGAGQAAGRAR